MGNLKVTVGLIEVYVANITMNVAKNNYYNVLQKNPKFYMSYFGKKKGTYEA